MRAKRRTLILRTINDLLAEYRSIDGPTDPSNDGSGEGHT
jgi:hypothetical protein